MKKILSVFLIVLMVVGSGTIVFADTAFDAADVNNSSVLSVDNVAPKGGDADLWAYRKVNVDTDYKWTSFVRVSDNINTYPPGTGGTVICTKAVTVNFNISGSTYGINVGTGKSVSSEVGHAISVGPNQRVYMGHRVYVKIETGTREKYNKVTGAVVESNKYKVTAPQYGEYKLLNY